MITVVSNKLATITPHNFKDHIRIAGITNISKDILNNRVAHEKIFSEITKQPKRKKLVLMSGKDIPYIDLHDFLKEGRFKMVQHHHFHYLVETMRQVNEKTLAEVGIPKDATIILPMQREKWMHIPQPMIYAIKRDEKGGREIHIHPAQVRIDNNVTLILQKN